VLHAQKFLDDQAGLDREFIEGDGSEMKRYPMPANAVDAYLDYRKMIERKDIDAVLACVPDHWHAKIYVDSMEAGKDVYGEKPLTLTIKQGRAVSDTAKRTGRVFQTGSQQRSAKEFRQACEYVRNGRIGKITHVDVGIGGAPQKEPTPNQPVPPGLNWDMWLGATPWAEYNPERCHVNFRWFFDYSGGMVTDWDAHHLDITQWGLGMDDSGPVAVEGTAETKPGLYNTFTSFRFKFTYANGVVVNFGNGLKGGITFHGEKGSIWCTRGDNSCDPEGVFKEPIKDSDTHLYVSDDHIQNFLDCVKTREQTICPAEVGHRSVTLCHLANICGWTGESLKWDPKKEVFTNSSKANQHLDREPRAPYSYI
ncbi:Gfo/Idh/MocA family oxidoreductase, partial [bacterium]|nr:Gfo/Idh/MocA family oxidoreductase [bacterium]